MHLIAMHGICVEYMHPMFVNVPVGPISVQVAFHQEIIPGGRAVGTRVQFLYESIMLIVVVPAHAVTLAVLQPLVHVILITPKFGAVVFLIGTCAVPKLSRLDNALLNMDIEKLYDSEGTNSNKQIALKLPRRVFRFEWLVAGLITGYVVSLFDLRSVGWLALLAALTGVSANWSS